MNILKISTCVALCMMLGCSTEELVPGSGSAREVIVFESTSVSPATKGTPVDDDKLSENHEVGVFAIRLPGGSPTTDIAGDVGWEGISNLKVTEGSSGMSYTPVKYWPEGKSDRLDFFAYFPYNGTGITAALTAVASPDMEINYTLSDVPAAHVDLMYAREKGKSREEVELTFHHALTRMDFLIRKSNAFASDTVVKVTEIRIKGAPMTGKLTVENAKDTVVWTITMPDADNVSIQMQAGGSLTGTPLTGDYAKQLTAAAGELMMIPVDDFGGMTLEIDVTVNGDTQTHTLPFSEAGDCWEKNKRINYLVTIMPNNARINAAVLPWTNAGQDGVVFDGEFFLMVDPYEPVFDKWEHKDQQVVVSTNVATGWTAEVTEGDTWLTLNPAFKSGSDGDELRYDILPIPDGTPTRTGTIRIKAGRMEFDIKVTQNNVDADFKLLLSTPELIFIGRKLVDDGSGGLIAENPDGQEIYVDWGPKAHEFEMQLSQYLGEGITGYTPPATSADPAVLVTPDAIDENDPYVLADPFYERVSRLEFTAWNSGRTESISKTVRLRQIYYSLLVADTFDYYFQGETYNFRLRSNSAWQATFDDPQGIIEDYARSGTGSTAANGQNFTFKLRDNALIGGVAHVTFSSPQNLFPPQTYTITAEDELPNSYIVQPGGSLTIPVRKAYRVWKRDRELREYHTNGELPIAGGDARLLWQDTEGMIQNVAFAGSGENATISVATNAGKEGNAVVAFTIGGEVYWSWHLWVTGYDPETENVANGPYLLMDRNIGARAAGYGSGSDEDIMKSYGLCYLSGRKDPFPHPQIIADGGITTRAIPFYDQSGILAHGTTGVRLESSPSGKPKSNLAGAIHQPMTYYTVHYGYQSWYGEEISFRPDLWVSNHKSDYDPCPEGWEIAVELAYLKGGTTYFTIADMTHANHGYTLPIGYFPAQGFLQQAASYAYVDIYATLQCTIPIQDGGIGSFTMLHSPDGIGVGREAQTGGAFNVRCVKK